MRRLVRALPGPVKHRIRRSARWTARIRHTRAWPVVRPVVRLARRVVDVDRILGRPPGAGDRQRAAGQVEVVRRRLRNLGFTERALADLRALAADDAWPLRQRLAAWELACWYADQYRAPEAAAALPYLELARRGEDDPVRLRQWAVLAAECRQRAGDPVGAGQVLERALARHGRDPDLLLAAANLDPDPAARVRRWNEALGWYGLSEVDLVEGSGPALDRLAARPPASRPAVGTGPLVSVIMPVHDAADVVAAALRSLLAQTWAELEVLVVDDASTDRTAEVVTGYVADDPRVRLLRSPENLGTYHARNLGLAHASGEFVTCHDADDWSHPEKLARQVRHLLAHPEVVANTSQQVRATPELTFHRRGKPGYFVFPNLSSLMFRREPVVAALGCWDSVRFGADAEFERRLKRVFGQEAVVNLETGPLSLQRQSSGSLTGDSAFGYHGYFMGARREYFEAYQHHHRIAPSLRYGPDLRRRPFPVPEPMLPSRNPDRSARRHFDVVIASDFRLVGGSTLSSLEEVKAHRRFGLRTGLVHMSYYDADPRRSVTGKVRELVDGDRVQMLVYGERISCDLLIVRYPPVLQEWQRYVPDVAARHIRVIVNQPPMSDYGPEAVLRYQIPRSHEHLLRHFGRPAVWHPIGPLVRQALHRHHAADLPTIELSDEDWVNIIDVEAWRRPARPPRGPVPRIGRHSRDHPMKWPGEVEELLAVYPDRPDYEVRVLGGATAPQALLGRIPDNWRVYGFGEVHPAEFLAGLDVFVYYPNPRWVESFGRVILEAMAVGVPVVLPEQFRPLFGDAARYADPAKARAVVDWLMEDEDEYTAQVETAWRFVEQGFGYSRHAERIRGLVGRWHG